MDSELCEYCDEKLDEHKSREWTISRETKCYLRNGVCVTTSLHIPYD